MTRVLPTKGNVELLQRLLSAFEANVTSNWTNDNRESARNILLKIAQAKHDMASLEKFGLLLDIPQPHLLDTDNTSHMNIGNGWDMLIGEDMVSSLGRYGPDAVSCIGEAVLIANALAMRFDTRKSYYRGEERYGYKLQSRAERHMDIAEPQVCGITEKELFELSRFQKHVKSTELVGEIFGDQKPYADHDPRWLPIMQHYDEEFGTRLLDLTSSIYSGLYFASIDWNGEINTDYDGLLYIFFDVSSNWRGEYFDFNNASVTEYDDVAPDKLQDSFHDWAAPEYQRIYRSSLSSPRELAQDGIFLVKGQIGGDSAPGQGFKLRVPAEAKVRIAKELWYAGYTPERMVRGEIGVRARASLAKTLGVRP